jgi:hypothetical protein
MKKLKNFLLDRLFEKTTWAGIALLGSSLDIHIRPEDAKLIMEMFLGGVGLTLIIKKEK